MGSVPVKYDFKAARSRIAEWKTYYRRMKRMGLLTPKEATIITMFIDELEREIQEAHASRKGKMTTARNSSHPVIQLGNLITPIIASWSQGNKSEVANG